MSESLSFFFIMETKVCKKCYEGKPIEEYHKNRRSKDGREHRCKACQSARYRKYISERYGYKPRLPKNKKSYYTPKKPRLPKSDKPEHKYCSRCREEKHFNEFHNLKRGIDGKNSYCKECAKSWCKEWVNDNIEHVKKRSNKYAKEKSKYERDNKTDWYFRQILRNQVRRYILKKEGQRTEEILGESYENVRKHIEDQFREGMSWDNHGEWHIDHIIPLSSGNNRDEWIKLNHYTNLQPLWAKENLEKGARLDWEKEE